jgi:RNA polymerase sigma-32 factor
MDCANLTPERERELLQEAREGSTQAVRQAATAELWESHSKLVISIACRYRHCDLDMLDLVGAGHLGLHTAIARFAPDRFDTRLSTYAIGWIRWYIQDHIRRNSSVVPLPGWGGYRQLAQLSGRLTAEARRSCMREGVEPSESEVCNRIGRQIGLPGDEVRSSLRLLHGGTLSLNHETSGDGGVPALQDTLMDEKACTEDDVIRRLDHAKLRKRILGLADEILGERESIVFLARCMTGNEDIAHLDDLAAQFGVSRERVYQLEASAKRKITTALAREGFTDFPANGGRLRLPPARAPRRRNEVVPDRGEVRKAVPAIG